MPASTTAASKATLMPRELRARVDGPTRAATLKAEPVELMRFIEFISIHPPAQSTTVKTGEIA